MTQERIEELFSAQKRVRDLYHAWRIDDAIREYDASILPAVRRSIREWRVLRGAFRKAS